MTSMKQTLANLQDRHVQFLEAAYHLRHARLIKERQFLMEAGKIYTEPWIDVMASYKATKPISTLNLPAEVQKLLTNMKATGLIKFDPPYDHQSKALEAYFSRSKE